MQTNPEGPTACAGAAQPGAQAPPEGFPPTDELGPEKTVYLYDAATGMRGMLVIDSER